MTIPTSISPQPPANPGLDYGHLKLEGTTLLQQWAGEVWTDYNESDPGVTTLEQLAYALTELSYRAEIPVADLLTRERNAKIDPDLQALYPADRIFPVNPLTLTDYRKLLIDRLDEVHNVWLFPLPRRQTQGTRGCYRIALYASGLDHCHPEEERQLLHRVRRVYTAHRSLCEDLSEVILLRPVTTEVAADLSLSDEAKPDAVLAHLLFGLALLLAPEPRRHSLASRLDEGWTPSEIFEGPPLHRGFIDSDQLQPKAKEVTFEELTRVILATRGVTSICGEIEASRNGIPCEGSIPVGPEEILRLVTQPPYRLRLFRKGIEVEPDSRQVQRLLKGLWERHRRTYPLAGQYEELLPFPKGRYRDLSRYYSVQNQYPAVYGIGEDGLPGDAPLARRGQAKQLKGYLLPFEQLLTNYFAQLAASKDLFSTLDIDRTYFFQSLVPSVPDIEPLLGEDYRAGLAAVVRSQDPFVERRNRFLDFLLALYSEALGAADLLRLAPDGDEGQVSGRRQIRAKLELLRHLVTSTRDRGRGFDYLRRPRPRNRAGLEIKSRIQLGIPLGDPRSLEEALDELAVRLAAPEGRGDRLLHRHGALIEEEFEAVVVAVESPASEGPALPLTALPRGFEVSQELLDATEGEVEVKIGSWPNDPAVAVVWRSTTTSSWILLGKFANPEEGIAGCHAFHRLLHCIRRHRQALYIVEHNLLRFGREEFDEAEGHRFGYSFTLTAVLVASRRRSRDDDYRKFVAQVIRENTPAYIAAQFCFLSGWRARRFERRYWRWREALRCQDRSAIERTSAALRRTLERCARRGTKREAEGE